MHRLLLILLGVVLAGCGHTQAANPAQDEADFQGTWNLVACIAGGESQQADAEWVVDGEHYTIRLNGQLQERYAFKLDPSKKHIDVHHHDTPQGTFGGKFKGIYEIKGDSLKVCYDLKGERYPKSMDGGPTSGQVVYHFQRERR